MEENYATYHCSICNKNYKKCHIIPSEMISSQITKEIKDLCPDWDVDHFICQNDLALIRSRYIESMLLAEKSELTTLDRTVIDKLYKQELLSSYVDDNIENNASFLDRCTDQIALFGGSWWFLSVFTLFLFIWIGVNTFLFWLKPIDPYPYIFLNLLLSCLTAIQAPVIMMSQNRKEAKDRIRTQHDYQINLKAELEIRHLHEKMDHLLSQQWDKMVKIQKIQIELLSELNKNKISVD
ncbi:MAG: DUF1003 domain-containing protein [Legionella sp.]|uniref:DUF1003 domain-containing protein n=1 Tax=Legionella sp. TaxID=459 RepID=UPI0039E493B1